MTHNEEMLLVRLQEEGYILHYSEGYVSSSDKGRLVQVDVDWLEENTWLMRDNLPLLDEWIYQDDTLLCVRLKDADVNEFRVYKKYSVKEAEALLNKTKTTNVLP